MNRPESRFMTPGASLWIFGTGLLLQLLSFPLVLVFTVWLAALGIVNFYVFVIGISV